MRDGGRGHTYCIGNIVKFEIEEYFNAMIALDLIDALYTEGEEEFKT
jgi:hypothetical protein